MHVYSFEKLEVYQSCRRLVSTVYKLSSGFPSEEKFGLTSQLRRATLSISLNIAEGTSRFSKKEKIRYLEISYGSTMEVIACLQIALDLAFIDKIAYTTLRQKIDEITNKINALKRHFQNQ